MFVLILTCNWSRRRRNRPLKMARRLRRSTRWSNPMTPVCRSKRHMTTPQPTKSLKWYANWLTQNILVAKYPEPEEAPKPSAIT